MKRIRQLLLTVLSAVIGGIFLYSAYTKLNPIQSFEYTMVEFAHLPWWLAAVAARFFVGLEAGLGALLLLNIYGIPKWVLKLAMGLLVVFSGYLIYLWVAFGNNVNCGCFGDSVFMSPGTSLIKNVLLFAAIYVLLHYHKGWQGRPLRVVAPSLLIILCVLPFVLYGIPDSQPNWLKGKDYHIDLAPLYGANKQDAPKIDLERGKHIIAFLNPFCSHCRMAAYKMHLMKERDTTLPFFLVIGGVKSVGDFWEKTKATNLPYTRLERDAFFRLAGNSFPAIYFVDNGWVVAKADYITLDQNNIEHWLQQPSIGKK